MRQVRDTLGPGGLFAVVELASFPGSCPNSVRLPNGKSAAQLFAP
jgi:hypothetical protein